MELTFEQIKEDYTKKLQELRKSRGEPLTIEEPPKDKWKKTYGEVKWNTDYRNEYAKKYYLNNKDTIREKMKKVYIDKIKETRRQPVECSCGTTVKYFSMTNHCKTVKHKNKISSLNI